MSRPWVAPVVAGLGAAAVVFAVVAIAAHGNDSGHGDGRDPESTGQVEAVPAIPTEARSGRAVFARMGCGSCHRLAAAGSEGEIGPDLDERLPSHDRASLAAVITDTDRGGFSVMPENFRERMTAAEIDALVDFLLTSRR
jgi:cytochrome c6